MGSPKVALPLPNGEIMGERLVRLLSLVCRDVVLVGEAPPLPGALASLPLIHDIRPDRGPLGGLEALLSSGMDTAYLALPCDLPLMLPSLLFRLAAVSEEGAAVCRVGGVERYEPFPLLLTADLLPQIERALDAGRHGVYTFLREIVPHVVELDRSREFCFRNVNRPADLNDAALAEHLLPIG